MKYTYLLLIFTLLFSSCEEEIIETTISSSFTCIVGGNNFDDNTPVKFPITLHATRHSSTLVSTLAPLWNKVPNCPLYETHHYTVKTNALTMIVRAQVRDVPAKVCLPAPLSLPARCITWSAVSFAG